MGKDGSGFPSGVHIGQERKGAERTGMERNGWDWIGHLSCIHSGMEWIGGDWRGLEGTGMAFFQASTLDRTGAERK